MIMDIDALLIVDLGANWTGPVGAATLDADVPDYFDGDSTDSGWLGAAHNSLSYHFTAGVGGAAIEARWQGGWFNYQMPLVKTIREAKISGSGLVTVSLFRDYRQSASTVQQVQLSPPDAMYDSGVLYDTPGLTYGPSTIVQTKPLRKATRGESFSLGLSNSTINRSFKINRFTTHIRGARVPSVVKVN